MISEPEESTSPCRPIGSAPPVVLASSWEIPWFRGRERCHLWVHHDYVALVSEGGRPSFALRRSDLVRLHWSPEGRSYSPYPYIRFQVVGGKWLERQFNTTESTMQLFESIAQADLPLVVQ